MSSENWSLGPLAGGTEAKGAAVKADSANHIPLAAAPQQRPTLRSYQADMVGRFHDIVGAGSKRAVAVLPTGAGKTVIAGEMVGSTVCRAEALFLAHRRELIQQASQKLWAFGIDAGIILAGMPARPDQQVQVASIQTLWARAFRRHRIARPPADLIVVDEAHHVRASTYDRSSTAIPTRSCSA